MFVSRRLLLGLTLALAISGCSSLSSSTPASGGAAASAYTGKVIVSEGKLPEGSKYKVLGTVEANARAGYSSGSSLYPMLADEARKLGANAVVEVSEGRKVTLLSWAAPVVSGKAVKVEDAAALKALNGSSH